jgi:hypothetical protein
MIKNPERKPSGLLGSYYKMRSVGVDRYFFAIPAHALKLDDALDQGEKGIILATADVVAGMNLGASLAVKDVTGFYRLAAKFLAAKALPT